MTEFMAALMILGIVIVGCWSLERMLEKGLVPRNRPRPRVQAYAAIGEEELNARLLQAPGSPVYQALLVVVDEEMVRLTEASLEEGLEERVVRHRLGGVDALAGLKTALENRIEQAREAEKGKETADERQ